MAGFTNEQLTSLRGELPILENWTYLNTGTVGLMPTSVLDTHLRNILNYETGGHVAQAAAVEGYERARTRLAALLDVSPDQITLNRNATDGINLVAARFPLSPGDEVITSTEEHPAMVIPWLAACHRAGATLRFVEVSHDAAKFESALRQTLSPSTRLIAISHVSCETGTRLPVESIRKIVGSGVLILIDASQSVGQLQVSIPDLNADFVIGNGHKWLGGPKGTGFAWISSAALHLVPPVHFASETVEPNWSRAYYQQPEAMEIGVAESAHRFEFGTRSWHLFGALTESIDYLDRLGWDNLEGHLETTSRQMKDALSRIPNVEVLSPSEWCHSSGLVTFSRPGWTGEDLSKVLWDDFSIAQRRVEQPPSVRLSCAYFTSAADIERVAEAVTSVQSRTS